MPRKVAFTKGHGVAVLEYEDHLLASNEVRIQTEYASGKHGTNMAMMDGLSPNSISNRIEEVTLIGLFNCEQQ